MTRAELDGLVRGVLETALERPIEPGEEVRRAGEPAWDSVKHIEVLFMIEEELGIAFAPDELAALDGLTAIVDRAAEHLQVP